MDAHENQQGEKALWRDVADTFAFLAQIVNTAPTEASVAELMDAVLVADVDDAAGGYGAMKRYAEDRAEEPITDVARELGVDWTLLFRGMSSQDGLKPPYAGAWLSSDGVGIEEMCAVNACYAQAGLGAGETTANRHDYLGVELEFAGRLAQRIAEGDPGASELLTSFVDRYLLSWFDSYAADAARLGRTSFWGGYLDLVGASLREVRALLSR